MAGQKSIGCETNNDKCPNHDVVSSVISTSMTSPEQTFESSYNGYEYVSSKCSANHLNAVEDGFKPVVRVKQNKTESSCSDSSSGILPVNHTHRGTLKRGSSFCNQTGSVCSSSSTGLHHRMEEPVTASSESGLSAQIDHKPFLKGRGRDMKAPSMIKDRFSFHGVKGNNDQDTSSDEEKRDVTAGKSSSGDNDSHITFCTSKGMINPKISGESENRLSESLKMDPRGTDKADEGFLLHESSKLLMTKPVKALAGDESTSVVGFDLNEDINTNEFDDHDQSVVETVSSQGVIHVLAKSGVPKGRPTIPMKFEGGLGWKGSSPTSAFHPACPSKSSSHPGNFTGIDLNVVAVDDFHENSCTEVGDKRAERLDIDLNLLCDDVDEAPPPSLPAKSGNPYSADLDLNANTSAMNAYNNVDWQGQSSRPLENKAFFSLNSRGDETRSTYMSDLSSANVSYHTHANSHMIASPNVLKQFEEMKRVSSLQPKLPYPLHMLPPHNYPSHGSLYVGPVKPFMFNMQYPGPIPCPRDPLLLKTETVPTSFGIPRLVKVAHGQSPVDITSSRHRIDVKSEDSSSVSVSKKDKAGELMLPAKSLPVNEDDRSVNQQAWYAKMMKRKEPEGGWDYYNLGQVQPT